MPAAAVPALTVSTEPPPAVTDAGLREAVAPLGAPETERVTVCALPEVIAVEMLLEPLVPGEMLRLRGLAEIEKSGAPGAVTVSVTVVAWVVAPSVPVTVSV